MSRLTGTLEDGLDSVDDAARLALWEAFSDFFLDTEPDEATFRSVARVVGDCGLTRDQAEAILWNEVFPVLHVNLQSVAGEWAGWSREWLAANLRPAKADVRPVRPGSVVREIERCWERVLVYLDPPA